MTLVKDMYDSLALKTGFPVYTNDTDCPDINRFLLEMIVKVYKEQSITYIFRIMS